MDRVSFRCSTKLAFTISVQPGIPHWRLYYLHSLISQSICQWKWRRISGLVRVNKACVIHFTPFLSFPFIYARARASMAPSHCFCPTVNRIDHHCEMNSFEWGPIRETWKMRQAVCDWRQMPICPIARLALATFTHRRVHVSDRWKDTRKWSLLRTEGNVTEKLCVSLDV